MSNTIYLSFGSNLGDRENNLIRGCEMVRSLEGMEFISCSPIYLSPAVEMEEGAPDFLNMVGKGEYQFTPLELLNSLETIERKFGHREKGSYKPRFLDIDILLFGSEIITDDRLAIPHPRITERPFVLVPLLQIEPELVHPVTGRKMATYLGDADRDQILLYKEYAHRKY